MPKQVTTFDTQGHRGCRGLFPENTLPAILHAIDLGVNTIEIDVVITKDKKVVLSHEPFFNHEISTKPNGETVTEAEEKNLNIYTMNYDSVQKYDVGLAVHPRFKNQKKIAAIKPLLTDVFNAVNDYCKKNKKATPFFNIETKCTPTTDNIFHPKPEEFVNLLHEVVKSNYANEKVTIQSFDFRTLQIVNQKYPDYKTAMLIEPDDKRSFEQQLDDLGFVPNNYSPHYSLVNDDLLKKCSVKNMLVIPWTVNDLPTMIKLQILGVHGIISDYPNLFSSLK